MSTQLLEDKGVHLRRFYGGDKRGLCYQITTISNLQFVQLTAAEMAKVMAAYVDSKKDGIDKAVQR